MRLGLKPTEIIEGYNLAADKVLNEVLETTVVDEVKDVLNEKDVKKAVRTSLMSKQYGNEDFLADLIVKASTIIYKASGVFNVDNIRVCKILGCGIQSSVVVNGMVFKKLVSF